MKTPTTSCRTCGYVQAQNESYIRCLECGTRLPTDSLEGVQEQEEEQPEGPVLPFPSIEEEKPQYHHHPPPPTTLDLVGFKQLIPFMQEMFRSDQEAKLQQILDRINLLEHPQVTLSHSPEVRVYVPEQSSPPLHETVVNLPCLPKPRKVVKIVERDERGLIVKITEQDQEQQEEEEEGEN